MRGIQGVVGAVAFVWLASAAAAPGKADWPAGLDYWVAPAGTRITPRGMPEDVGTHLDLAALRGERESFYVVVQRPKQRGAPLTVAATPLEAKAAPPIQAIRIYRAAFVPLGEDRIADALLPITLPRLSGLEVDGAPGENLPLFVEIEVPHAAPAATYRGEISIQNGDTKIRVPVALTVLPGELPRSPSLPTAFSFSALDAALANGGLNGAEQLYRLGRSYAMAALEDRVTLVGMFGPAPTYRTSAGDGTMDLDFTAFDRQVGPLLDGLDELDGAKVSALSLPVPPGLSSMDRFKYLLAFRTHLKTRGWADRLIEFEDTAADRSGLLPTHYQAVGGWDECRSASRNKAAEKMWWDLSPIGRNGASLRLGADPLAPRAIGWLAFASGASGLRYEESVEGFTRAALNGGISPSALFYPGYVHDLASGRDLVVESVRMKLLRDGLEDYELLKRAKAAGKGALVDRWVQRIAASPSAFGRNAADYEAAKRELAGALDHPAIVKPR